MILVHKAVELLSDSTCFLHPHAQLSKDEMGHEILANDNDVVHTAEGAKEDDLRKTVCIQDY